MLPTDHRGGAETSCHCKDAIVQDRRARSVPSCGMIAPKLTPVAGDDGQRLPRRWGVSQSRNDGVFEDFNRDELRRLVRHRQHAFGERPSVSRRSSARFSHGPSPRMIRDRPGHAHSGLDFDRLVGVLRRRTFTIENAIYSFVGRGTRRPDQRRCRWIREDPRPDLRRLDGRESSTASSRAGLPRTWGCGWATGPTSSSR